jgi:hypothetical protein
LLGAGISSKTSAICQKVEQQIPQISDFRFLGRLDLGFLHRNRIQTGR